VQENVKSTAHVSTGSTKTYVPYTVTNYTRHLLLDYATSTNSKRLIHFYMQYLHAEFCLDSDKYYKLI